MSFYNAIFRNNPLGSVHLAVLGFAAEAVPRMRDCYLRACQDGKTRIMILTRTGNSSYDDDNAALMAHAWFHSSRVLSVDGTYREFLYDTPENYVGDIESFVRSGVAASGKEEEFKAAGEMAALFGPDPDERWKELLQKMKEDDMSDPDVSRAVEMGKKIFEQILGA